jgi:hypothetical protein
MAHIAMNSTNALDEDFDDRVTSTVSWPPRSPDINSCGFCLWGTLAKLCVQNPHSLEEYQEDNRHEISAIPLQKLRLVSEIYSRDVMNA